MTESIRNVFFLLDANTHHILYISPAFEAIYGQSCESLYANPAPWSARVHPNDRAYVQQKYEIGALAGPFEYECRILRPDGSVRWIEVKGAPVLDAAGLLVRVAGAIEDITQRKHALQALHDSRQRLDRLVLGAADAIITVDEYLRVVLSNPAAESMFGYTSAELRGQPLDRFIPDRLRASDSRDIVQPGDACIIDSKNVHCGRSRACARTVRAFRSKRPSPPLTPTGVAISPPCCAILVSTNDPPTNCASLSVA